MQLKRFDVECAIAQALSVVGDVWSLLIVRDVAGGTHRFDDLLAESGISRKVLAQRLVSLVEGGVLEKSRYLEHPPRYEYHLTAAGQGLVPVLIALQNWGTRFLLGDGSLTATAMPRSPEVRRVRGLVGSRAPSLTLVDCRGRRRDPIATDRWTVVYGYPGAYAGATAYPAGWDEIPGAAGCTLESITYRDRIEEFEQRGADVVGVSTQRPDEQAAFARKQRLGFTLLSDQELEFAAALRLPTFRAGGADRLKRVTLLFGADRTISAVLYPVPDPAQSVDDVLRKLDEQIRLAA